MRHLLKVSILFLLFSGQANTADSIAQTVDPAVDLGTIVVSIKPLYSLVAHLTEGISQPVLLMTQSQSAHHYTMRPSERRLLARAGMIVWIGPTMEFWLNKVIKQQEDEMVIVTALQADGLKRLNKRNQHSHGHHGHAHASVANGEHGSRVDPHIWLSTYNAAAISKHIAASLIRYDPENTKQYGKNLEHLLGKIEQLKNVININLTTQNQPFIAHHDAFQYFEHENALNYIDTVNFNENAGTSLKQLREINRQIAEYNIQCLVYQAPRAAIIDALTSQSTVKAVELDPLGMHVSDDKNAWFELMQRLTLDFNHCLSS